MDARTYYKQHPEDIIYYDDQVVVTLSNRRDVFVEFRDPGTLKIRYTLTREALRTIWRNSILLDWRSEYRLAQGEQE